MMSSARSTILPFCRSWSPQDSFGMFWQVNPTPVKSPGVYVTIPSSSSPGAQHLYKSLGSWAVATPKTGTENLGE